MECLPVSASHRTDHGNRHRFSGQFLYCAQASQSIAADMSVVYAVFQPEEEKGKSDCTPWNTENHNSILIKEGGQSGRSIPLCPFVFTISHVSG